MDRLPVDAWPRPRDDGRGRNVVIQVGFLVMVFCLFDLYYAIENTPEPAGDVAFVMHIFTVYVMWLLALVLTLLLVISLPGHR
ncbi:hypothetical protein B296_00006752 [Ensete ventricosum]|uniref:Uncharacterized protein n=1 Tax=Ensete ventricosum TaxID=4639 RepID=A0A427AFY2_ENSVE|nr:hypothetical protein B296_00006752 [Ensete ventricosum]